MDDEFYSRISFLTYDLVCKLQKEHRSVELNNVLDGFKSDFFTIMVYNDENLDEYSLIYIGNNDNEIKGLVFKSGRKIKDRDIYTFRFAQTIETEFPEKNSLIIFNTFQSQLKSVYETFGILCIPKSIANLKNASLILPSNKTNIDEILQLNLLSFYQSFFDRNIKLNDTKDFEKIYLMYDQKEAYFKIGKTKTKLKTRKKGVSEATLRAINPMIEIIVAWRAPSELETKLHSMFKSKRKRGEWFDLRPVDLEKINEFTLKYDMINISNES